MLSLAQFHGFNPEHYAKADTCSSFVSTPFGTPTLRNGIRSELQGLAANGRDCRACECAGAIATL
jgi:hypothetical protein